MNIDAAAARGVATAAPPGAVVVPAPPPPAILERLRAQPVAVGLVAACGLVALYLRVWGLGSIGLDASEAATAGEAGSLVGVANFPSLFAPSHGDGQLFHLVLGGLLAVFGVEDIVPRVLVALFGVLAIAATFLAARSVYGTREAILAAAVLSLMPYHVLVSRAVSPDVLASLWVTLALAALARFASTERSPWVLVGAASLGLGILTDASALAFVPPYFAFVAHRRWASVGRETLVGALAVVVLFGLALPVAYGLSGQGALWTRSVGQALLGQGPAWYRQLAEVGVALGLPVVLSVAGAMFLARRQRSWREVLLALWVFVPLALLLAWPDRNFAELGGIAAPVAILAARGLVQLPRLVGRPLSTSTELGAWSVAAGVLAVSTALLLGMLPNVAGSAQVPGLIGGRDTAVWVGDHVPPGASLLTTDRAFAGVLEFYAQRDTLGLTSVAPFATSDDRPDENPDLLIRQSAIQYIVWDTYSAETFPAESERLLAYAQRYNGREIYRFEGERTSGGERATFPITIVYEVRP